MASEGISPQEIESLCKTPSPSTKVNLINIFQLNGI